MGTPLGPKYIPYTYMDPLGTSRLESQTARARKHVWRTAASHCRAVINEPSRKITKGTWRTTVYEYVYIHMYINSRI